MGFWKNLASLGLTGAGFGLAVNGVTGFTKAILEHKDRVAQREAQEIWEAERNQNQLDIAEKNIKENAANRRLQHETNLVKRAEMILEARKQGMSMEEIEKLLQDKKGDFE